MEAWSALKRPEAVRLSFFTALAGFLGFRNHLISDQQLRQLIRRWVEIDRIEQATVPIAITATDVLTGDGVLLTTGGILGFVAASCAIPGLFPQCRSTGVGWWTGVCRRTTGLAGAGPWGHRRLHHHHRSSDTTASPRGAVALAMNSVSLVTSATPAIRLPTTIWAEGNGGTCSSYPHPSRRTDAVQLS